MFNVQCSHKHLFIIITNFTFVFLPDFICARAMPNDAYGNSTITTQNAAHFAYLASAHHKTHSHH